VFAAGGKGPPKSLPLFGLFFPHPWFFSPLCVVFWKRRGGIWAGIFAPSFLSWMFFGRGVDFSDGCRAGFDFAEAGAAGTASLFGIGPAGEGF